MASLSLVPSGSLAAAGGEKEAPASPSGASKEKPNLLVIHTDEHNFRTLGCYRDTLEPKQAFMWGEGNVVETPHIDSIARNGALCTNFYATSPVCTPSRAAFVSGQYPQETGAYRNNLPLNDDVTTFAELLQQQGYATGYAGKWHLDGDGKPQWEPERDFGFADNRFMFNRGHWKKLEDTPEGPRVAANRKNGMPSYQVAGADEASFTTDWLADKAVAFIKANKNKPFCVVVSIPDPHGPDTVRSPYDDMYSSMEFQKPHTARKAFANAPSWAQPTKSKGDDAAYFGMVKCIDDNVGKLMSTLKDERLIENTIVVFTSDHGDLRGEHGRQDKGVPLEASAKIPFVIQWPGQIKPGRQIDDVMSCIDFLPTILGMMGCETAGKESGRDASALFTGDEAAQGKNIAILRKGQSTGWVCAVTERYKLVLSPSDEPWLLDRKEDPDELVNFASKAECRETVRYLAKSLQEYHVAHKDPSLNCPKMQYDLAWAVGDDEQYDATRAPQPKAQDQKQ